MVGRLVAYWKRGLSLLSLGTALLALLLFVALSQAEAGKSKNPLEGDREAIEEGGEIFDEFCADCHMEGGKGANLTDGMWKFGGSDAQVYHSIDMGHPGMPPMGEELEEEEIWMVIAYIRSIKGE